MDVKGIVTGIVRDATTGAFKRAFTVENDVTDYWLGTMAIGFPINSSTGKFGANIFIADGTGTLQTPRKEYVGNVLAAGFVESGVTSPIVITPPIDTGSPKLKTPPYIQFQQRFSPPTTDRTITVIGITVDAPTSANIATYTRARAQTYVQLTPTCSQTTTETLDIFYRIQFLYSYDLEDPDDINVSPSEVGISKGTASIAAYRYGISNDTYFYRTHHAWHGSENFNLNKTSIAYLHDAHDYLAQSANPNPHTTTNFSDLLKTDMNMDYDISMYVGKLIGSFGYGERGGNTLIHDFRSAISITDGDSPLQGVFGHSVGATKPFFDSTTTQSGTGTLALNADSWTNPDWPKMYRIDIINGGATGTATYKLKVRNHLGFDGNAYRDQERAQLQMVGGNSLSNFEGFDIARDDTGWFNYNHPTKKWHCLAANPDEICIIDLSKQTGVRTHVSTQPAFVPTKIGSVVVDDTNDTIWVPCRETGLYKIVDPSNTRVVSVISAPAPSGSPLGTVDRCLGIGFTPNTGGTPRGRMWAIWSDSVGDYTLNTAMGLYWTENEGVTWSRDLTWAPETMATWQNISFNDIPYIVADPNHVDMRLLIPYNTQLPTATTIQYRGMWHDNTNGTVLGPANTTLGYYNRILSTVGNRAYTGDDPRSFGNTISVSPDSLRWGGPASITTSERTYYYPYGTTTNVFEAQALYNNWIKDENGDYALLSVNDTNLFSVGAWKPDDTKTVEQVVVSGQQFSTRYATSTGGLLYLGEGVFFGSSYASPLTFTDKPDATGNYSISISSPADAVLGHSLPDLNVWTDYGWDGAAWVKDDPGAKSTHTATNDLIDGVQIQFADALGDVGGVGNWIATDYYTFGVADGVWLDGSTEFHHKASLYQKPTTMKNVAIEAANLPSVTKTVDTNTIMPSLSYALESLATAPTDSGRKLTMGSYVLDSFAHYIQTNEYRAATAIGDPLNSSDVHAGITFNVYWSQPSSSYISNLSMQFILGLIPASQLLVTPTPSTTDFAIRIDPATNADGNYINISVIHKGVVQSTLTNYRHRFTNSIGIDGFKIEIKKDGHIIYTVNSTSSDEVILFDTSAGSPPPAPPIDMTPGTLENYHIEFLTSGGTGSGFADLYAYGPSNIDYYTTLGDGSTTGFHNPKLYSIDYDTEYSVTINGVAGIDVGNDVHGDNFNGTITPLNTGEYSLFRESGVIRYSATDATGSIPITVQYNEISND